MPTDTLQLYLAAIFCTSGVIAARTCADGSAAGRPRVGATLINNSITIEAIVAAAAPRALRHCSDEAKRGPRRKDPGVM